MNVIDIIKSIFSKEIDYELLDDRIEFRLNKNEKILIKKYCELKHTDRSKFFRSLAMKEINSFIKLDR